jgi:hypothetical protein
MLSVAGCNDSFYSIFRTADKATPENILLSLGGNSHMPMLSVVRCNDNFYSIFHTADKVTPENILLLLGGNSHMPVLHLTVEGK